MNSEAMLSIKKIFAILLIATFLVSIPLTLVCVSSEVCSVTFVYKYDDVQGKPSGAPGKVKPPKDQDLGYAFLRDGFKWKDFPINVVLDDSLAMYQSAIADAMQEWDSNTGAILFGSISVVSDASFDVTADGKNEMVFGDYPTEDVIAVCRVWFSMRGRRIVEFDILFDDADFTWGTDGAPTVMDVQNIATHEIGHGLGLADLYDDKWDDQTMYGYASEGETIKRDLATGDIAGIQALYGL